MARTHRSGSDPSQMGTWLVLFLFGCSSSPGSPTSNECPAPDETEGYAIRWPQDDSPPTCIPQPRPCPHKGGNAYSVAHDQCADRSGNVAWDGQLLSNDQLPDLRDPPLGRAGQGCDVELDGRFFDAMSWSLRKKYRRLLEVSTRDWSNCYKYNDALKGRTINRILDKFTDDCLRVLTCDKDITAEEDKLTLMWGFSDQGFYWTVMNYLAVPGNDEKEIMSRVRALGLPDDPHAYCIIEQLQRCR